MFGFKKAMQDNMNLYLSMYNEIFTNLEIPICNIGDLKKSIKKDKVVVAGIKKEKMLKNISNAEIFQGSFALSYNLDPITAINIEKKMNYFDEMSLMTCGVGNADLDGLMTLVNADSSEWY